MGGAGEGISVLTALDKLYEKLSNDQSDANWSVADLIKVVEALGFSHKSGKGSHRVFAKPGVPDLINIQEGSDGKAKKYQVKQVRQIARRQGLLS